MTTQHTRPLGLAQLSSLTTEPPKLVELAAQAGFAFVGIRVRPVTAHETPFNVQPGSPMLAETLARLADTGLQVKDTEFLLLDGSDQRDAWNQMFEAGQALGAESLTVAVADTDQARVLDNLGQMVADGKAYGITPALEAISYQAVNSYSQATSIAEQTGVTVLVDTLHAARFGATTQDLRAAAPRVPMIQLCDSVATMPATRDALVEESRSGRFPAGEGGQHLAAMIAAVDAGRGAHEPLLPISVEVPNRVLQESMNAQDWVNRLYTTTRDLLDSMEPAQQRA
ncbi:sugar phosphate isomerase/epimerase family protein [Enteractinococcus coprophilus]|uniref:Xylose isomerase-like TIM barrel protein n=1 Tax=Enteractinococcus coprophilus TaxID=1027633 RepID=A0A543ANW2_9MICC|nr:sugar phosphate isomerase/epimerase [Enteractinococcus coprophilus]TQL74264.1 xylose isomerase-like TIM barrel protein [Enteractinococcus coprophilus]